MIYAIGLLGTPPAEHEEDAGVIERLCKDTGGIAYFPPTGRPPGDRADESTHADAEHVFSVFLHRPATHRFIVRTLETRDPRSPQRLTPAVNS